MTRLTHPAVATILADLRAYGVSTAPHRYWCAEMVVYPRDGQSTACTCGLDRLRAAVAAHDQAQGGADRPCRS